ncbi:AraC family transcriptional regulator [Kineobactrum salinum]|uniref:AraC family transcriptional regulator n=1 Tax=Kineobactrum salinum TaxID=2708301 RepID=A0A6C0TZ74_9GAMM|nr:AraC family transcriptional regulator [Kineobactrum salinum]
MYCKHRLSSRTGQLDACHYHMPFNGISFNYMQYGTESRIEPESGYLRDFYLIQLPLKGWAHIESGGQVVESDPARASVINPSVFTKMLWSQDCRQFLVQITKERLERITASCLGMPIQGALVFDSVMDNGNAQHASWWRHLFSFICEYSQECSFYRNSEILETELDNIIKALLYSLNHNYTAPLLNDTQKVRPRHVRLAMDYIHDHISEKLSMDTLVELTGVSERRLYEGFRRFQNISPMRYVQQTRLKAVRRALQTCSDSSVTQIATEYGFTQLGRFAALYRQVYGELPSETGARRGCAKPD